ncbi:BatD family protein [Chiayiivirga flava]|uniref:Protein BatD n=1 Tax=Chiayiivirga flava TaxID=659595 RepID=A0A7W8G1W0_9GAMM|nr:BatD family protein [Chiayiivirga flava]MBB5209303.1 hypothetical protein [Chiayiivirga flava]
MTRPHPTIARCLLLFGLLLPLLALAAPRAWLDRDSMRMGETVTLNVETDIRGEEPDFSVLDQSFRRLGTSSQSQISIVNGQQSAKMLWAIALEPLQEGVIGIPALQLGNESTEPLTLTVLPAPSGGSAAQGEDVFMETTAEPAGPYVQQQVRYVVRLYYAVTLLEGQLEEPKADAGQVRRLGQDLTYQKTVGGRRYNVVERRYALIPEASGRIEIAGPQFRGRALRPGQYNSMFGGGVNLSARADKVALDVRARPADAPTPWLPAQQLTLTDESGVPPDELRVGEPLTLTLRMSAQGLAAEQLPELTLPRIEGAEVYPDQETTQTRDDGEWLRGERVRKFAVVPTRAGPIEIGEIGIDWWNTATDRRERAVLPARSWMAVGGSVSPATAPDAAASPGIGDVARPADAGPATGPVPGDRRWQIATAVFAVLWLVTAALLLRRREPRAPMPATPAPPRPMPDAWKRDLRAAVAASDARGAAQALLRGARSERPDVRELGALAAALAEGAQRDAVLALERSLYRDGEGENVLALLERVFAAHFAWRATSATATDTGVLPPLYPERRAS